MEEYKKLIYDLMTLKIIRLKSVSMWRMNSQREKCVNRHIQR